MIFQYGSYRHDSYEVDLTIDKQVLLDRNQSPYGYKETWTINGFLQATSQNQLTTKLRQLEAAYSIHNQNAILYRTSGGATAHQLRADTSINGLMVTKPPSYPEGKGAEYSTFRTYTIQLEASYRTGNESNILEYTERVSTQGSGGPRHVVLEVVNGNPIRQQVSSRTAVRVTQSGSAVGLKSYPTVPTPLFPDYMEPNSSGVSTTTPKPQNGVYSDYRIEWNYSFLLDFFPGTQYPRFQ